MRTKRTDVAIAVFLTLGLGAPFAQAQLSPPSFCPAPAGEAGYSGGLRYGGGLVTQAWSMISDCQRFGDFRRVVLANLEDLTLPPNPGTYTLCRYTGTIEGVFSGLVQYGQECGQSVNADAPLAARSCIFTGGRIRSAACCTTSGDFPGTCGLGPCGCAAPDSAITALCSCPDSRCFMPYLDGYGAGCVTSLH